MLRQKHGIATPEFEQISSSKTVKLPAEGYVNGLMEVSIIIPMYNAGKTIIQTLRALKNQTRKDFEVIVVDDGSTDTSARLVAEFSKQSNLTIRLVHQENSGPAKARNLGVKHSKGDIIIFLDSDCIPPPNWVQEMVSPLNKSVVGCNCGYKVKNRDSLIARYVDYEIAKRHEKMIGRNIDTIGTYSASFVKAAFVEAGAFNTEYTAANAEDFDLAFSITRMGYNLRFIGEVFVWHFHPDSLGKYLKQQFSRGYWRVKMYLRNRSKAISGDSYTRHEAQVQFILSSLAFLSLPLMIVKPYSVIIGFGILLLSNAPLGLWVFAKDKRVGLIAPIIASLRSLAGTIGAYTYLVKNFPNWLKEAR
ncbi:MAG: glycosyltransferase family 2 protein [Dehalococcoidales bacterium]|nr:glycosyltransferase family 2 protein [Dehalococcoidales bacterium]